MEEFLFDGLGESSIIDAFDGLFLRRRFDFIDDTETSIEIDSESLSESLTPLILLSLKAFLKKALLDFNE